MEQIMIVILHKHARLAITGKKCYTMTNPLGRNNQVPAEPPNEKKGVKKAGQAENLL